MGKFGFDYLTDEARDKLESLNIVIRRERTSASFMWAIYTDSIDMLEEDLRDRYIEPDSAEFADTRNRRTSQSLRHWYCKEKDTYYYLIKEAVFKCEKRIKNEVVSFHGVSNVTHHVKTVFDYVPDPGSIEDILRARRPSFDIRQSLF